MNIRIEVSGHPVAKGRGRAVRTARGIRVITPEKTRRWEDDARIMARQAVGANPPIAGPVAVEIRATFSIPAGWPEWKRLEALGGWIAHTTKPDADNLAKAAMDALNGIVFVDDSQATSVHVVKNYGEKPGVVIHVDSSNAIPAQVSSRAEFEKNVVRF